MRQPLTTQETEPEVRDLSDAENRFAAVVQELEGAKAELADAALEEHRFRHDLFHAELQKRIRRTSAAHSNFQTLLREYAYLKNILSGG
jgi:hypothetical protein